MRRKYNDNDSSDEEGFQQSVIKVLDNIPIIANTFEGMKMEDAKSIIEKKFFCACYSIYTSVNLLSTQTVLFHPLE